MSRIIFLHVGPPKTGSTTIQTTLFKSRKTLRHHGYVLPGSERNQKYLTRHLRDPQKSNYTEYMENFTKTIVKFPRHSVIVSDENLGSNLKNLVRVANYLKSISRDLKIIVYVRHPVLHAISRMQQKIRNHSLTIAEADASVEPFDFRELLDAACTMVGRANVIVSELDRSTLIDGDLRSDFLKRIGYTGPIEDVPIRIKNEAISMPAALLADAITRLIREGRKPYGINLRMIPGAKFCIGESAIARLTQASDDQIKWLRDNFQLNLRSQAIEARREHSTYFQAETIAAIGSLIYDLSEEKGRPVSEVKYARINRYTRNLPGSTPPSTEESKTQGLSMMSPA